MGSASFLDDLANDLLACAVRGLDEDRTQNPEPGRVFTHHGVPPVDACASDGQLTVHWDVTRGVTAVQTPRADHARTCAVLWQGVLVVQLWRCYRTVDDRGAPISPAAFSTLTAGLNRDGWCLLTQITAEHFAGTLFDDVDCGQVNLGPMIPVGPLGNAAGWQMIVTVALEDSGPDLIEAS